MEKQNPKFLTGEMNINESLKSHSHSLDPPPPPHYNPFCFSFSSLRDDEALEAVWTIITNTLTKSHSVFCFVLVI